jgi:hypothetical protein
MDELDDLDRLAALDRAGMLQRAGARGEWWNTAQSALEATAAQVESLCENVVGENGSSRPGIGLYLPPELNGIGHLVALVLGTQDAHVRCLPIAPTAGDCANLDVIVAAVNLPVGGYTPDILARHLSAGGIDVPVLAVAEFCRAEDHPVQTFLYLYGFLALCREALRHGDRCTARIVGNLRALQGDSIVRLGGAERWAVEIPVEHNPAKQLAARLLDRIPIFWGSEIGAGLARDFAMRQLWYAERAAFAVPGLELARTLVMARTPGYWPNTAVFVRIDLPEHLNRKTNEADGSSEENLGTRAAELLARRRFACTEISCAEPASTEAGLEQVSADGGEGIDGALKQLLTGVLLGLELGEWLALYSAFLYHVDPADRVPLELIYG